MSSKNKLINAIIIEGGLRVADLGTERARSNEDGEYWRVYLKRDVSFIWGGIERTLPEGTVLGLVYIDPEDGEISVDIPFKFIEAPGWYIYPVDWLEREMLAAE